MKMDLTTHLIHDPFHLVVVQFYSKNSEIRTPVARNTRLFELNLGHNGFREMGIFMNHFNNCLLRTYVMVRRRNVSFTHQTLSDNMLNNCWHFNIHKHD